MVRAYADPAPQQPTPSSQPPIVNTPVPNSNSLAEAHNENVSNTISLTAAKPGDPEPYVVGRTLARGRVIAAGSYSEGLAVDILWSVGEIQEFEARIYAGLNEGLGTALGENEHYEGTAGQAASPIMSAIKGSYDALANKAHSVLTLGPNFQPKTLDIRMLMKGLKLFDPRPSPQVTAYSTTPALVLARLFQDSGYTLNDESWTSVGEVADYNEELVGSPGIKRWEISGQIWNRRQLRVWVQTLAAYAHCFIDIQGDTVYFVPDAPRASNHTVSGDTAFLAGSERKNRPGTSNVPDAVICHYQELVESGDNVALVSDSYTYGTPGGSGTITQLQMPFVPDVARAGRHAEEAYRKAAGNFSVHFDSFDEGLQRAVGDRGAITYDPLGLTSEAMYLLNNHMVAPGRWRREYHVYDANNYSDVLYTSTSNYDPVEDAYVPVAGPSPTISEEVFEPYPMDWNESYTYYNRLIVTWTGSSNSNVKRYFLRITENGFEALGVWIDHIPRAGSPLAEQTHTYKTTAPFIITEGHEYEAQVFAENHNGEWSDTPGTAKLAAMVLFYEAANVARAGDTPAWSNPDNATLEDGTDNTYAEATWGFDEGNETDYLEFTYSLADSVVASGSPSASIQSLTVTIRAKTNAGPLAAVVNIANVQFVAGGASPEVEGTVMASNSSSPHEALELTQEWEIYTITGTLAAWGLSNAQALELLDDSGDGRLRLIGECEDTSVITGTKRIWIDWVKLGVNYTD